MYLIGRDYAAGKTRWTARALAGELDIPSIAIAPLLDGLEGAGLILATERGAYRSGPRRWRPFGSTRSSKRCARCTAAGWRSRFAASDPPSRVLNEAESAMRDALNAQSLKDLSQQVLSVPGDGHFLQQYRTHAHAAARIDVIAHRRNAGEHGA